MLFRLSIGSVLRSKRVVFEVCGVSVCVCVRACGMSVNVCTSRLPAGGRSAAPGGDPRALQSRMPCFGLWH